MLLAAVDYGAHAFLDSAVLGVDPVDPGERLVFLHLAIQEVVVPPVGLRAEGRLVDVGRTVSGAALHPILVIERRVGRAVVPVVDHRGAVIHRDPDVPRHRGAARVRLIGADLVKRQDEVIGADVHLALVERPDAGVVITPVRQIDDERGRLPPNERVLRADARPARVGRDEPVQDGRVRGVDAALERLQPVALLDHLRHVTVRRRRLGPGELGQRRLEVRWVDGRIGRLADLVLEAQLFRLVHHVHATAADVELPAVVDAPETALLVASEEERRAPMRAVFVEETDAPFGVAERHQLLAQQLDAHRRAVGLGQLLREQRGNPVPAHGLAHRRAGADAGDELVLFACQHASPPR